MIWNDDHERECCGAVYFNQATTNLQGADYRHGSLLATFGGETLDDAQRSYLSDLVLFYQLRTASS